jgi:hypothetical protein
VPRKQTGPATDYEVIDHFEEGIGWIAHPEEGMRRASHALAVDGDVYLIDPVSIPDLTEVVESLGTVAGVVLLLDRHARDATSIARQFEVPIHLPARVDIDPDIEIRRHDRRFADTGYEIIETVDWPGWREASLFDGETLVVPEAVGTAPFFTVGEEPLGVQPVLRLTPPSALRGLEPQRILVGHGAGVHENAAHALDRALSTARRYALHAGWNLLTGG